MQSPPIISRSTKASVFPSERESRAGRKIALREIQRRVTSRKSSPRAAAEKSPRGQVCERARARAREVCSEHAPRQFPMKSIPGRPTGIVMCGAADRARAHGVTQFRGYSRGDRRAGSSRSPPGTPVLGALLFFGLRRRTRESCCTSIRRSYTRYYDRASLIRASREPSGLSRSAERTEKPRAPATKRPILDLLSYTYEYRQSPIRWL